ncbi:AAC(3) family N-acetyltransferase [Candidatus Poribacteria bacterium]
MDIATRRRSKAHVTKEDIVAGLQKLGLKKGDNIGVHSSLGAFGYVEGGADAVVDALLETVGSEGNVVVPAYSSNIESLERTPEDIESGVTWKYRVLPYDPETDSCWTGAIPDAFWRRKEAVRSAHVSHSLAAIGPEAEELCQGWDRLLESDGHILILGVHLGCCSSMHLAEKGIQLPQHIVDRMTPPPELAKKYKEANIGFGFGPYPDFALMEEPAKEHGIMKMTEIGEATVKLLRLRELIDLYADYLRRDPDMFYHG